MEILVWAFKTKANVLLWLDIVHARKSLEDAGLVLKVETYESFKVYRKKKLVGLLVYRCVHNSVLPQECFKDV